MSPFNLEDYEPVDERIHKFWADHPLGRITTELVHVGADGYIVKASIWRGFEVKSERPGEVPPPGGTGYAQEAVTERGVNATSALENCETSAIGRALANLGYAAKGKRLSREEMASASSSPARRDNDPTQEPASTGASGRDGAAEDVAGEQPGRDVGEASVPAPATHSTDEMGYRVPEPRDKQADMDEFHPNKPHRMKPSDMVPGRMFCQGYGSARCAYYEDTEGAA